MNLMGHEPNFHQISRDTTSSDPNCETRSSETSSSETSSSETNVTDIELMPDGRVFVFGTSLEVLRVLDELQMRSDEQVTARLQYCRPNDGTDPTDNEAQS